MTSRRVKVRFPRFEPMDELLASHSEICCQFILPRLVPSSFLAFMMASKQTNNLVQTYLLTANVKHGIIANSPYVNDTKHGVVRTTDNDLMSFYDGQRHGKWIENNILNGVKFSTEISRYRHGLLHGKYTYRVQGSIATKCYYYMGKKHGPYIEYGEMNVPTMTVNFVNGLREGKCIIENRYVITIREHYKAGVLHGKFTKDKVCKHVQGEYKNGLKHGEWKVCNAFGSTVSNYYNGQLHGDYLNLNAGGTVIERCKYKHGKLLEN